MLAIQHFLREMISYWKVHEFSIFCKCLFNSYACCRGSTRTLTTVWFISGKNGSVQIGLLFSVNVKGSLMISMYIWEFRGVLGLRSTLFLHFSLSLLLQELSFKKRRVCQTNSFLLQLSVLSIKSDVLLINLIHNMPNFQYFKHCVICFHLQNNNWLIKLTLYFHYQLVWWVVIN